MHSLEVNPQQFTGYRINIAGHDAKKHAFEWAILRRCVEPFVPVMEAARQEQFFCDDMFKATPVLQMLLTQLQQGELFICWYQQQIAGFILLKEILHCRSAVMEAYGAPAFRRSLTGKRVLHACLREVVKYCFAPFGPKTEGLGLNKLKMEICRYNLSALRSALAIGCQVIGSSPFDAFFNNEPVDMVHLELLNPEYFDPEHYRTFRNVERRISTKPPDVHIPTAVHAAADVPGAAGPEHDSAASIDADPGDQPGKRDRGLRPERAAAILSSTEQQRTKQRSSKRRSR